MEIGKYKGYEMNSAVSIGLKKVYLGTDLKNSEAPYIVLVLDGSRRKKKSIMVRTIWSCSRNSWMCAVPAAES